MVGGFLGTSSAQPSSTLESSLGHVIRERVGAHCGTSTRESSLGLATRERVGVLNKWQDVDGVWQACESVPERIIHTISSEKVEGLHSQASPTVVLQGRAARSKEPLPEPSPQPLTTTSVMLTPPSAHVLFWLCTLLPMYLLILLGPGVDSNL